MLSTRNAIFVPEQKDQQCHSEVAVDDVVVVDVCVVIDTAGGVGSGDVVLVGLMHASSVQGGYIKK